MITIDIDASQITRLEEAVARAGKNIAKEVAAAINKVSKKTRLDMGGQVRDVIAIKKAESEKPIKVVATATAGSLQALVRLKKTDRLGLRHFKARQDKKGVSYKIATKGKRERVDGAFLIAKFGGNAFIRKGAKIIASKGRYRGKLRQPIVQLNGVSVYGAYRHHKLALPLEADVLAELHKQIERRINQNILRAEGVLKH